MPSLFRPQTSRRAYTLGAFAVLFVGGCGATGPDDRQAREIQFSQFAEARFWGIPIGAGQIELQYFANTDTYPLTASTEVYPLRNASFSVSRTAGDSLSMGGSVNAEGVNGTCGIQLYGQFDPNVLDGRALPLVKLSEGAPGAAQLSAGCTRPDTYWGPETGYDSVTSASFRATFVPTADSAGRFSFHFERTGVVRFADFLPDTALTYRVTATAELERRRDGSLYSGGVYIRGGPNDPGSAPSTPSTPPPAGSITCPNPPTGYICVERNNLSTPLKLRPDGVLRMWYHSASFQTCIGLGAQEPAAFAAYRAGPGYGGAPITGLNYWGALVSSDGVLTGTADGRYIYIYTGHPDPQVALLLYDLQTQNFVTMGFQRVATCPY